MIARSAPNPYRAPAAVGKMAPTSHVVEHMVGDVERAATIEAGGEASKVPYVAGNVRVPHVAGSEASRPTRRPDTGGAQPRTTRPEQLTVHPCSGSPARGRGQ